MIRVLRIGDPEVSRLRAAAAAPAGLAGQVRGIIDDVRARGDAALRELTEKFDGARLAGPFLDEARWSQLASQCPPEVRNALELAHRRVRDFHAPQVSPSYEQCLPEGGVLRSLIHPLGRAACYVPGGRAAYPSTVIMTVTPARLAGVPEVIVATPPRRDGSVPPEVAAAARIAGAAKILTAGGAQAIAALALGTRSVPRVDVIVGPGNAYVTEAKKQLSGEVRIDSLAGPTEVLIVADSSADPAWVAADLLAQAEHDPLALAVLVTPDPALADAVAASLTGPQFAAVLAGDLDQALAFADEFAPEHLELMVRDPRAAVDKVPRAAAVFAGHFAPVPVGDYLAGPNHTLPTGGTARFASPLSVSDFVRRQNVIEYSDRQLAADAGAISALARAEGLPAHAAAVEARKP